MGASDLSDAELLLYLQTLARREREDVAEVVVHLAEADRRELLIERGFPSLFAYCVKELGYPEAAAYLRIRAARAYRRFPEISTLLRTGELHLDAVARIFPHLEGENGRSLLEQAKGKTSRQVISMLGELSLSEEMPDIIRAVGRAPAQMPCEKVNDLFSQCGPPCCDAKPDSQPPSSTNAGLAGSTLPSAASEPQRVRFAFTADEELAALVRRAREVLRHKYPDGRLERLFKDALVALLEKRDPDQRLVAALPRPSTRRMRRIPQWVKDIVWRRDSGRCAYVSREGRRCETRDGLEYDHVTAWALGGASDNPDNIQLLCGVHNRFLSRELFGGPARDSAEGRGSPAGNQEAPEI